MPSQRLASFLIPALFACGAEEPSPAPTPRPANPTRAADLAELGYAGWDEDADDELSGVTRHDPTRSWAGWNLATDDHSVCFVLGMDGREVHRWTVPNHDQVERFLLLEGGRIVALSVDQGVTLLDRDSRVIWQVALEAHHDLAALPDGGFLIATYTERELHGRRVRFDQLVWLDADGRIVDRWDTWEHREALDALHAPTLLDGPAEGQVDRSVIYKYYHLNAVRPLEASDLGAVDPRFAAGNLLLCMRNTSLLVILDRSSREVLWSWGPDVLDFPHSPVLTPAGSLLVFDNGRHRGSSRVLEIDPRDGRTLWSWEANPPEAFFTATRGACQRLPNGNTLITESDRGHVFEVDRSGDLVWDYWNPEVSGNRRRLIFAMHRVALERLPQELRSR